MYLCVRLSNLQEEEWKNSLLLKPKLRFYRMFKQNMSVENFVKYNLTPSQRSITAQFRAGILPLQVETGRFRNVKYEERICLICDLQKVEDEMHFMFECPCYAHIRQNWLKNIFENVPNFNLLNDSEKLCVLFEKYHRCTSKYILSCFNYRKEKLFV